MTDDDLTGILRTDTSTFMSWDWDCAAPLCAFTIRTAIERAREVPYSTADYFAPLHPHEYADANRRLGRPADAPLTMWDYLRSLDSDLWMPTATHPGVVLERVLDACQRRVLTDAVRRWMTPSPAHPIDLFDFSPRAFPVIISRDIP